MADLTFQLETFDQFYADAAILIARHYDELTEFKDMLTLDPDIDAYHKLEAVGALRVLTARLDGDLIGYYLGVVHTHLHYRTVLVGNDDIYFVAPEHRSGRVGFRLFSEMFKVFGDAGCKLITTRTKVAHPTGPLLTRLGMREFETTYIKATPQAVA